MTGNYLITFEQEGTRHKLCRILFGNDGTYYVTSPYHPLNKAFLFKASVNYALQQQWIPVNDLIDSAEFDDEDGRVKLAHHPDGYLHFSGQGVLSGRTADGHIKGIGVVSWPLHKPVRGPAFGMAINGVTSFEQETNVSGEICRFVASELSLMPEPRTLCLEGHYFPPLWRRFVRRSPQGIPEITVVHPNGALLSLKVIFPAPSCALQGFLGLEVYSLPREVGPEIGFCLSGSTGNIRMNDQGQKIGDGVFCIYPREFAGNRSLHWPPPPNAIAGTSEDIARTKADI